MTPDITDPKWTAYLLGDLPEEAWAAAEAELDAHPALRDELDRLHATLRLTQDALREPVSGSDTLAQSLREALDAAPDPRRRIPLVVPTALAAGLALFIGLRVLLPTQTLHDETGQEVERLQTVPAESGRREAAAVLFAAPESAPEAESFDTPASAGSNTPAPAAAPAPVQAPARALTLERSRIFAAPEAEVEELTSDSLGLLFETAAAAADITPLETNVLNTPPSIPTGFPEPREPAESEFPAAAKP